MPARRFNNFGEFGVWLRAKFEAIFATLPNKLDVNGDASQLTALNANALTSGSIPLERLTLLGTMSTVNHTASSVSPTSVDGNEGDLWFVLEPLPMTMTVVSTGTETLSFSFINPNVDGLLVDWGDGSATEVISGNTVHTYTTPGTYTTTLAGTSEVINMYGTAMTELVEFGENGAIAINMSYSENLVTVPALLPSTLTNFNEMFAGCAKFNSDLSAWDVSAVTTMVGMFEDCPVFNSDLSGWNVSSVTQMDYMFSGCTNFNQDISGWVVSAVTNMSSMFNGCINYNMSMVGWDVSSVTTMNTMFGDCIVFNQDLSGWNITSVTNMGYAFSGCSNFNQNISAWSVGNVTLMNGMFTECGAFNQDLSGWDTTLVTNMTNMFSGAEDFVQDLSGWVVTAVGSNHNGFDGPATNPSWTAGMKPVWAA